MKRNRKEMKGRLLPVEMLGGLTQGPLPAPLMWVTPVSCSESPRIGGGGLINLTPKNTFRERMRYLPGSCDRIVQCRVWWAT